MNTMLFSQRDDPGNTKSPPEKNHEIINTYEHEINTEEGSEYLDDTIRIKEQPLEETASKDIEEPNAGKSNEQFL